LEKGWLGKHFLIRPKAKAQQMLHTHLHKTLFSLRLFPVLLGLVSGFAVFYFLYFFGAYGIQRGLSYSGHTHLFRSVSFGILTFGYLAVLEAWLKPRLKVTGRWYLVLWYVGLVVLGIQLIFLLFNYFWNWQVSIVSEGQRKTGYWHINGHRPEITLLPHTEGRQPERWKIEVDEKTLLMSGLSDSNRTIQRRYVRGNTL
jgi:hypothetical protein